MNGKHRFWTFGVAGCFGLAAWGLMVVPGSILAKGKPGGGGGGGGGGGDTAAAPCVLFDDLEGDDIGSDGAGSYCNDKSVKTEVTFTNDGHLLFDTNTSNKTGAGRSLFIDFGTPITVTDTKGQPRTFQSTADLVDMGADPDVNMQLGAFQGNFDMLSMAVGETRSDVNLHIALFMHFPGQRQETGVRIALSPTPVENDRHCPGGDPVAVTYLGLNDDGLMVWRIMPGDGDNDLDGQIGEDALDGVDNDNDGLIDEDPPGGGLACVTQNHFAGDEVTVGFLPFQFGFTVTAAP